MDSKFFYTLLVRDIYGADRDLFNEKSLNIYDMLSRMRKHIIELIDNTDIDFSVYTLIVVKRCAWKKHSYGKKLKHKRQIVQQYWFPTENDEVKDFIDRFIFKKFCTSEVNRKLKGISFLIPTLNKFLTG